MLGVGGHRSLPCAGIIVQLTFAALFIATCAYLIRAGEQIDTYAAGAVKRLPMPAQAMQSRAILSAARDFARRVALAWPLQHALLFGSQTRGKAGTDSDTDLTILLNGESGDFVATKLALDDVAYDVLLDSGIRIQPLPIWAPESARREKDSNLRLLKTLPARASRCDTNATNGQGPARAHTGQPVARQRGRRWHLQPCRLRHV